MLKQDLPNKFNNEDSEHGFLYLIEHLFRNYEKIGSVKVKNLKESLSLNSIGYKLNRYVRIYGFINNDKVSNPERIIKEMSETILSRGPDDYGSWNDTNKDIFLFSDYLF